MQGNVVRQGGASPEPGAGQAGPSTVDDMQALIAATREMARSTRTAVDSIGMPPDRLTGILLRLDQIEANALGLDAPPEHSGTGAPPARRH